MNFGLIPIGQLPTVSRVVQSADPVDLETRVNAALADLAANPIEVAPGVFLPAIVSSIDLAGGGDGHTFVVTITASPVVSGGFGGFLPATITVACYLASEAEAIAAARAATFARFFGDGFSQLLDEDLEGASKGTRFMGIMVTGADAAIAELLLQPTIYFYDLTEAASGVVIPITAPAVPEVVTGAYTLISPNIPLVEISPGVLEYTGQKTFGAVVRARVAVRRAAMGADVVAHVGILLGNPLPPSFASGAQSSTATETVYEQINAESVDISLSGLVSPSTRIAIGLANDTNADALQVLSAELVIEPR
jgi:hypothetical protein